MPTFLLSTTLETIRRSLQPQTAYRLADDDILFFLWWCIQQQKDSGDLEAGLEESKLYSLVEVNYSLSHSLFRELTLLRLLGLIFALSPFAQSPNSFPRIPAPLNDRTRTHRYFASFRNHATGSPERSSYGRERDPFIQNSLHRDRQGSPRWKAQSIGKR